VPMTMMAIGITGAGASIASVSGTSGNGAMLHRRSSIHRPRRFTTRHRQRFTTRHLRRSSTCRRRARLLRSRFPSTFDKSPGGPIFAGRGVRVQRLRSALRWGDAAQCRASVGGVPSVPIATIIRNQVSPPQSASRLRASRPPSAAPSTWLRRRAAESKDARCG
jgi:hypothetical protein